MVARTPLWRQGRYRRRRYPLQCQQTAYGVSLAFHVLYRTWGLIQLGMFRNSGAGVGRGKHSTIAGSIPQQLNVLNHRPLPPLGRGRSGKTGPSPSCHYFIWLKVVRWLATVYFQATAENLHESQATSCDLT